MYEDDAGAQTVTHTVLASLRPHEAGLKYLRRFEDLKARFQQTR